MRHQSYILLAMLAVFSFTSTKTLAAGDEGSEDCRVAQLEAQNLAVTAIANGIDKKTKSIVTKYVNVAKRSGQITKACAKCIMREFDFDYPLNISQQASCGVDPPEAYCGDGINGPGELCDGSDIGDLTCGHFGFDQGEGYLACTGDCTLDTNNCVATCGNGIIQPTEQCDDGNTTSLDGCSADCNLEEPFCGNETMETGEQCDGEDLAGLSCQDLGFDIGALSCTSNCTLDFSACDDNAAACGNGIVEAGEQCDDGNDTEYPCTSSCMVARCGDGDVNQATEECDDGNHDSLDSCLSDCRHASCGDGYVLAGVEECDDGNVTDDDGCDASCLYEEASSVDEDGDGWLPPEDCDDDDPNVHPYANWNYSNTPGGNGYDWNCDGVVQKKNVPFLHYESDDYFSNLEKEACYGEFNSFIHTPLSPHSPECGEKAESVQSGNLYLIDMWVFTWNIKWTVNTMGEGNCEHEQVKFLGFDTASYQMEFGWQLMAIQGCR